MTVAIDENVRQQFVEIVQDEDADDLLVRLAGEAMLAKLAKKRADGRMGWWTPRADNAQLKAMLAGHVAKGDMVDVLNIAAMILVREKLYGDAA
jgi:hypothetical protein